MGLFLFILSGALNITIRRVKRRLGRNTSFFCLSVRNEKPEPHYSAIPVFLMLIGTVVFIHMYQPPLYI